jgi:hypothetical protein
MASNIKLGDLGTSAGLNTATTTVSGSYVATVFLTGSVGGGLRDLPDTPGTLTGTSPRPYGQQYEFIEFDGKIPTVTILTIASPDTSNSFSGKRITWEYSIAGMLSGETGVLKIYVNGADTGEYYNINGNTALANGTYTDSSNAYIVPNSINTLKLVLNINSSTKTGNDSKTVYVYPIDLTITSITQTPSLSGATTYNYTTGSISFSASVAGGVSPYSYNWNSGAGSVNPYSFNNASTTTDTQITLVVTDSHTPTADTASGTGLPIMRRPVSVSISNAAVSEPYVDYTLDSTVNYNVQGLNIYYNWSVGSGTGYKFGSASNSADPVVYYSTLGSKTHRLDISSFENASIRNHTTSTTTVQVSPTANVVVAYATNTETWAATFDSVVNASYGTRTYEYQVRSKDSGGTYTAYGSSVFVSSNSISAQSFAGKTANAQYIQIRVRVKRTYTSESFDEVSTWVESNEALVPQKGIVNMGNQTDLLTGGDRSFDGSVTIGGVADTGYNTPSITAVTTGGTVTASISKPSSNVVRVVVNNPCTNVSDGTATHVISLKDGNGYNLTKSFTTQYKINTTSVNLTASWGNERYYNGAANAIANSLAQYSFTLNSFAYKVGAGSYSTLNSGNMSSSYSHTYTAPTSDQTWTYRIVASGGTYTASDTAETSLTVYGYPGQSYGYSVVGVPSSGTLSQVGSVVARISRSSGNFAKISVNSYYVTRPTGTNVSPAGKSDANISDSATSFDSDAFSLYDSDECGNNVVGVATLMAYLKYAIDGTNYYLHQLIGSDINVTNEPSTLSSTLISGITNDYAIRGNNIIHEISYASVGPPLSGYYDFDGTSYDNSAYAYLSQNTDPSSFTGTTVSGESVPERTALGYYQISTNGTFCRKTRNLSFGYVPTSGQVGTNITLNYYARAYRVTEVAFNEGGGFFTYTYSYSFNGSDSTLTSSKTYTVRGRRLNASLCSWSIVIYVNKGYSDIQLGLGSGTLTGPDGAIDYYNGNLDGLTYVFQRYNGTSWVDITGSSYDPGTFGTTLVRVKFTDTWGTEFTSTQQSATTSDLDYTFTLSSENNSPIIYGYIGPSQTTAPVIVNPSAVTDYVNTAFSTGTSVTRDNLPPNAIVFAGEHGVDSMDERGTYSNFPGVYTAISVIVTGGSTPTYGIFRTFTYTLSGGGAVKATNDFSASPYGGIGSLQRKSFQMYNSGDSTGNSAVLNDNTSVSGNWRLMAYLTAPSVYGATATYRLHGQKASNNTDQPTDYYIVLTTRSETNEITLTQISTSCDTIGVRARTGTLTTANKIIIQTSTDNSTWTDAHTITSIAANTNYDRTISGIGSIVYVRALLYETSTLKTTSSTLTYTKYTPVANNSSFNYFVIALNATCTSFSYRVNRPTSSDSNTHNYYNIDWYTVDEYGTTILITSAYTKSFNTNYSGQNLSGFPCNVLIRAVITPVSITGCVGDTWNGPDQIYVSDSVNGQCNCAGGGNGCLVYGTMVEMGDGTFKKVENLELGEVVKSLSINGLDASIEDNWKEFYTNEFEYEEGLSIITNIFDDSFTQYYVINNNLKLTFEHPVFIKRAEVCMFSQTENLVIGDYIFKETGEFELVSSIDIIDDFVQTININIEENDVYFANGVLVHNLLPPKDQL